MTDGNAPGGITPSQTVGPYFAYCMGGTEGYGTRELVTPNMVTADAAGARIRVSGQVFDGAGKPVADSMLELWQADGNGRYARPASTEKSNSAFTGFGRCGTKQDGSFIFDTVKPGQVQGPGGKMQAPHINCGVFARGVVRRLHTRIYFEGETGNFADPVLALVPEERRVTLIARRDPAKDSGGVAAYRFDVRIQGADETVFFEA